MWWKIGLVILAIPLVLILIVVIVGMVLPRGHTASRRVVYNQPAQRVWDVISDFATHADWREGVARVERLDDRDGKPVWREIHQHGDRFDMMVEEVDAPRRLVTRIVDNAQFGGTWTWTWTIEPLGDEQCAMTIREDGEIYNPVFRFVGRLFMDERATMDRVHRSLGAHFGHEIVLEDDHGT